MNPPVLIIGSSGQVGSALAKQLGPQACVCVDFPEVDLENLEALSKKLEQIFEKSPRKFSAIINAAAYTAVDQAEKEFEKAHKINALAPGIMAKFCAQEKIPFVHYSTDYVFSGAGNHSRTELEPTGPLQEINAYGRGKLEGESLVQKAFVGSETPFLIFRTTWVFDAHGKNFFRTMLKLAQDRSELKVVSDQVGAPTYAPHIAAATLTALQQTLSQPVKAGLYNMVNAGETNWAEFAHEIFTRAHTKGILPQIPKVIPITTEQYPTPARRPKNSRMSLEKLQKTFGIKMLSWQAGLEECFTEYLKEISHANS